MEELIPLVTIISIFVILPGMAMWFADRRRRARQQDDGVSQTANADLLRLAERMENRIDSLERILDTEAPAGETDTMAKLNNFRRYPRDGYIAGVCAGVAVYLDWNVKWIRVLSVLTLIFSGGFPILVVYGLLWYVMDEDRGPAPYARDGGHRNERRFDQSDSTENRRHYSAHHSAAAPTMDEVKLRFSRLEDRLRGMEECVSSNDFELRRELRKLES